MHDIAALDKRGIPGCAVISEELRPGAVVQSRSLGFEPATVWVPHPIQNRTAEELAAMADAAMEQILASISN